MSPYVTQYIFWSFTSGGAEIFMPDGMDVYLRCFRLHSARVCLCIPPVAPADVPAIILPEIRLFTYGLPSSRGGRALNFSMSKKSCIFARNLIKNMNRIQEEKKTVEQMLRIYCRKVHHNDLCGECQALLVYAHQRLDACKFGEEKPSCKKCPVHCYKPDMREKIRRVMRFAGPRMILYHPTAAIKHLLRERK